MLLYTLAAAVAVLGGALAAEDGAESNFKNACYVCTSVTDPNCAETGKLDAFKKNCASEKPKGEGFEDAKAIGCRKILQEVEGENRVVRQCAYSGKNVHAFKSSGNEGVRMFYYQCDDDDYCNAASATSITALSLVASAAFAILLR